MLRRNVLFGLWRYPDASTAVLIRASGIKETFLSVQNTITELVTDGLVSVLVPAITEDGPITLPDRYTLVDLGRTVLGVTTRHGVLKLHESKRLSTARAKETQFVRDQNRVLEFMEQLDTYPSTLILALHFKQTVAYIHAILYSLVTGKKVLPVRMLWMLYE